MSLPNPSRQGADDPSVKGTAVELKDLLVAYAKQETLDPLKTLGRYVGYGLLGSVLLAVATVFGAVTAVRVVQAETGDHLSGNLSWVPYGAGILLVLLVVAVTVNRIVRSK